jgi:hypothetical protein
MHYSHNYLYKRINKSMSRYEKRFFKVLNEQDDEREAMLSTLDKGTSPGDFDVSVTSDNVDDVAHAAADAISKQAQQMKSQITEWVSRCDEFLEFLNGTEPGSIQYALATSKPDTILDRMKQSEQRKIGRVATELAALAESFKTYVSQSENSQFKYV